MTAPKDSAPSNFADLINQAQQSIAEKSTRQRQAPATHGTSLGRRFVLIALLGIIAYLGYALWHRDAPPPKARVADDLERAIDLAKASIEAAKTGSGELPTAIPNASLASVVVYQPGTRDYKLTATMMGVRVTLEENGIKTRDLSALQ